MMCLKVASDWWNDGVVHNTSGTNYKYSTKPSSLGAGRAGLMICRDAISSMEAAVRLAAAPAGSVAGGVNANVDIAGAAVAENATADAKAARQLDEAQPDSWILSKDRALVEMDPFGINDRGETITRFPAGFSICSDECGDVVYSEICPDLLVVTSLNECSVSVFDVGGIMATLL